MLREFAYKFHNSPLLKYTIAYLTGILIGSRIALPISFLLIISFVLSLLSIVIYLYFFKKRVSFLEYSFTFTAIVSFIMLGWLNISISDFSSLKTKKSKLSDCKTISTYCIITERPAAKLKYTKIEVLLPEFKEGMILYLDKNCPYQKLGIGDTIQARLKPRKVRNFEMSTFDYAKFLAEKGIYSTSYIKADDFVLRKLKKFSFKDRINRLKECYISKISGITGHEDESATLIAITIGDKSFLDPETRNAYSASGTMHLLAVSGLHVGFIYSFLSFVLLFLGNSGYSKIIRLIIIVTTLWIYALIVGFSPSITRAVIMATIYEICKNMERDRIGMNTLSLSALVINVIKPHALFDIGFQLSFIALLSIIVIHPKIGLLLLPKNTIVKYIWTTLSISLSCQIGTSLITISSFGFFPLYFLLANLIAIPLSAIILYVALGQLAFLGNAQISVIISDILRILTGLLNSFVSRIESLPHAIIELNLNNGQILSIVLIIAVYFLDVINDTILRKYVILSLIVNFIMCSL
ncbi:MAG: ComEC/Rec2 family competence protein [Bacteroidales bacterium]|jgi:competence protein ComEC